jgi:TonB family protein
MKRLMVRAVVVFMTCALLSTRVAADNSLEDQLTDQYRDKVLALRHSFKSGSQEYSADGTPLKNAEEGAWTLYGRMLVKKINVDGKHLTIEGRRAICVFDKTGSASPFPEDRKHPAEKLKVIILLQQPLSSIDDASVVLSRVLALTPEDILNSAPAYWRSQLAKQMGLKVGMSDAMKLTMNQSHGNVVATDAPTVFRVGDQNVKAPRITYHREPPFSEIARSRLFQGVVGLNVVIDTTGKVQNIDIVHPIGMGLDDNAVATIGSWQFEPGTKDGEPVAVAVYIEVSFRLY